MTSLSDPWAANALLPNIVGLTGTAGRFARFGGISAGADVDGVFMEGGASVRPACPGTVAAVEAGGSFSSGASLETDSVGRAVAHSTGTVIARALEGFDRLGHHREDRVQQRTVNQGG